jgi:hypothetical protein
MVVEEPQFVEAIDSSKPKQWMTGGENGMAVPFEFFSTWPSKKSRCSL